jgi:HemY protein
MRGLLALLLIAALIAAAVFLADHPGHVEIVWQNWQLETSVGVLAAVFVAALLGFWAIASLLLGLARLPRRWRRRRQEPRRRAGDAALTRGIVALASGDAAEAQLYADRAAALLADGAPLPLLLAAEAATQQGDMATARRFFAALLEQPQSAFLGLRGLLGQALRARDDYAARRLAERARLLRPNAAWLPDTLLALYARAGEWEAARDVLAEAARRGTIPAPRARHHRGAILYELSRAAETRGDRRGAARLAARAQGFAPGLVPAAVHHARVLLALGRNRAARRAVERAWRRVPHPDLARVYLETYPQDDALAHAAALQRLAVQNAEAQESQLAIAEAALAAQLWGEARRRLGIAAAAAAPAGPTRRLCLLMARLEEGEAGDTQKAREWLDQAGNAPPDPAYRCAVCGAESQEWHSVCRLCGAFDTFAWGAPAGRLPDPAAQLVIRPPGPAAPLMLPASEAGRPAAPPSGFTPP